jgi:hypothetical protein
MMPRAYRLLKEKRACNYRHLAKFISRLKIVQILNTHSATQRAAVSTISYKPLSDLSFVAVTCPLPPLGIYKPLMMHNIMIVG